MTMTLGDPATAFSLPATDGSTVSLDDFADQEALLVVFSCNHCPYVMAWEDRMNDLAKEFGDTGLGMVAINSNNAATHPADSFGKMVERASDKGFAFPYAHDESQDVATAYAAERTPEFFLFDTQRILVYHGALDDSQDPDGVSAHYLRDAIVAVLDGDEPTTEQTPAVGCTIKWK